MAAGKRITELPTGTDDTGLYYVMDGAGGTQKVAAANAGGTAIAAHNSSASAHGELRKYLPYFGRLGIFGNSITDAGFHVHGFCGTANSRYSQAVKSTTGGATSATVLANILATSDVGDLTFVQEGTNDAAQAVTVATHYANMGACVDAIRERGGCPVVIPPPPIDQSYFATVNKNAIVDRYLAIVKGCAFVDPWAHLIDTDGTAISGGLSDGVHPFRIHAYTAGKNIANSIIGNSYDGGLLPRGNTGQGMFTSNAMMLTDAGADGIPDGWSTISLSGASHALVAETLPRVGNAWECTVNQAGESYLYRSTSAAYSIGDVLLIAGNVGLTSSTNMWVDMFLRFNGSGVGDYYITRFAGDKATASFSAVTVIPAGTTSISFFLQMGRDNTASNYSGTVRLSGVDVYDITNILAS